jgi:group I intron endonuclease
MPRASDHSSIYGIRHTESGRVYVGSAVKTNARWRQHRSQLQRGTHHSTYLQAAWNKHGERAFEFFVLETVDNACKLLERENFWIASMKSADRRCGFNCCPVAGSQLGMKHSDQARAKMSATRRGKKKSPEHQARINKSLAGRKLSEQCKQLLSAARKGSKHSEQARMKMSESRKGKRASLEARAKISAALKARHAAYHAAGVTISGKPLMGYALRSKLSEAA